MGSANFIRTLIALLACSLGCGDEGVSQEVTDSTDCASITDWQDQIECVYAKAELEIDNPDTLRTELETLSEPADRDLVLYRLAVNHPERAQDFCGQTTTRAYQDKCTQVLGRPHLGTKPRSKVAHPQVSGRAP